MRQTYFEGTAPPDDPQIPEVADAVDAWLAAKKKQALAAEATKIRNATMLELLTEHGIERYPYHDDEGRKHYVVADKTPRAKTVKAPSRKQEGRAHGDEAEVVESRRVPRTAEHDRAADPFGATRAGLIEEAEKRQSEWKVGEERGASPDGGKPLKASIAERTAPKSKGKRGGKKPKLEVVPDAPAEDAS